MDNGLLLMQSFFIKYIAIQVKTGKATLLPMA